MFLVRPYLTHFSMQAPNTHTRAFNPSLSNNSTMNAAFERVKQQGGSVKWRRAKTMYGGQGAVGKTSTANALVHVPCSPTQSSTRGVTRMDILRREVEGWQIREPRPDELDHHVACVVAEAMEGDVKGKGKKPSAAEVKEVKPHSEAVAAVSALLEKAVQEKKPPSTTTTPPPPRIPTPPPPTPSSQPQTPPLPPIQPVMQQLREDLVLRYRDRRGREGDQIVLSVWDCGGQEVFYDLHHLFLTKFSVYQAVFNMDLMASPSTQGECLRVLIFWLNSVYVHAEGAPVILVGTHMDMMRGADQHRDLSDMLDAKLLGNLPVRYCIHRNKTAKLCFFPVDNTNPSLPQTEHLRTAIVDVTKTLPHINTEVPLRWLHVLETLNAMSKGPDGRQRIHLHELKQLCVACNIPVDNVDVETHAMLDFFHQLGYVMHFNGPLLDDLIILDPQWLADMASRLVRDFRIHQINCDVSARQLARREWEMLTEQAVLDTTLLQYLWVDISGREREQMLHLLERFGLLVPLPVLREARGKVVSSPTTTRFLVPAILPTEMPPNPYTSALSKAEFVVLFGTSDFLDSHLESVFSAEEFCNGFLPSGLFPRLLGKAVEWSLRTSDGFHRVLCRWEGVVAFGHTILHLAEDSAHHCVRVRVLGGGSTLEAMERITLLTRRTLAASMPNLYFRVLIPLPPREEGGDGVCAASGAASEGSATSYIDVNTARLVAEGTDDRTVWQKGTALTTEEVCQACKPWQPVTGLQDHYDAFISYRREANKQFAMQLHDSLSQMRCEAGGREHVVFLDTSTLEEGHDFIVSFMEAMTRTDVVVPVVSQGAVERMIRMQAGDEDNLLTEWYLAVELLEKKKVPRVYPLFLGPTVNVGEGKKTMKSFFDARLEQRLSGEKERCVKTFAEVDRFLKKTYGEGCGAEHRSVREVVEGILRCNGVDCSKFGEKVAQEQEGGGKRAGEWCAVFVVASVLSVTGCGFLTT